ncbi:MAG: VOC family protein [Desulfomonilaceae bacterium]
MKLHHLGYAVPKISYVLDRFLADGCSIVSPCIADPILDVRVQFIALADSDTLVELVEPISDRSPVHTFLRKRNGFYHLCFEVPDLQSQLDLEKERHCTIVVNPTKAEAFHGDDGRVAFVVRRSGMLIEFLETKNSLE